MVIQCEQCETRFRLDESKIPAKGTRVRCSRCKTAFFVAHPSASHEETIHEVVAEATDSGMAVPESARDLESDQETVIGGSEEEQWEFEDSAFAPSQEPARQSPPSIEEELASAPSDLGPEREEVPGLDLDFGGDFGSLDEPEEPLLESAATSVTPASAAASAAEVETNSPVPEVSEASSELPDELSGLSDFFDDVESPIEEAAEDEPSEASEEFLSHPAEVEMPPQGQAASPARFSRPASLPRIGWLVNALLSVMVVAMWLAGMWMSLSPAASSSLQGKTSQTISFAHGKAQDVRLRFIENAWSGPLWVVSGSYAPAESSPQGVALLRLFWLDAAGKRLATGSEGVPVAGAAIPVPDLRQLPPEAIVRLIEETPLNATRGGAFDIVVTAIPAAAVSYELEEEIVLPLEPEPLQEPLGESPS